MMLLRVRVHSAHSMLASDAIERAGHGERQRPMIQTHETDTGLSGREGTAHASRGSRGGGRSPRTSTQSPIDASSERRYSCHSIGTSECFFVLHDLHAGTTLPRLERPPRPSGTT